MFFPPYPCRERLIHLLAIKPFKKPELQARLARGKFKDVTWLGVTYNHLFPVLKME